MEIQSNMPKTRVTNKGKRPGAIVSRSSRPKQANVMQAVEEEELIARVGLREELRTLLLVPQDTPQSTEENLPLPAEENNSTSDIGSSGMFKLIASLTRQVLSCNCRLAPTTPALFHQSAVQAKGQYTKQSKYAEEVTEEEWEAFEADGLMDFGVCIPTAETHQNLIGGIPYKELPIVYIRSTKNNTIITVGDHRGKKITYTSCGVEGFKNAKKGTNVAAQATGMSAAKRAREKGVVNVRVMLKGLGIGRLPSVKGLQMGGLNIVSISDNTRFCAGERPRKQRRL